MHKLTPILLLALTGSTLGQDEVWKLLPEDGMASQQFGGNAALSGTTALVGSYQGTLTGSDSGSAYLFDVATGQQIAKLVPSDGASGDTFSISVAISGSTALIGAALDDDNGNDSGSAYLFDTITGQQIAKLLPDDGNAGDFFGAAVSISGNLALVGAYRDDDNGVDSGSAYLFDTTTGQQIAKILPSDGEFSDLFGISVAICGTTALVGAQGDDDNGPDSGAAYLFDTTTGQQIAKLLSSDGTGQERFGQRVGMDGSTAIVGAPQDGDNGFQSGSAYLFDTTTGQQTHKLLPNDGWPGDIFGAAVSISENTAIVGALLEDDTGPKAGSIYLFDTLTGSQTAKIQPSDVAANDNFGVSVSIHGSIALVGSRRDDDNGSNSGSAYLFDVSTLEQWILSPVNGHWYRSLSSGSWIDANAEAQSLGGHLATIRDQAENDWLQDTFATNYGAWIGYTDQDVEGSFAWISGELATFENWEAGQPDDLLDADWAMLQPGTGEWRDEPSQTVSPGIVEVISDDCDGDQLPDAVQIAQAPSLDWNGDGVLDTCTSSNYCSATTNSAGVPAVIGATGTPVISANDFTLEAWGLPLNEFGYFLMSETAAFIPGFGGSAGNLCLGAPIVRFSNPSDGGMLLNSGATGTVSFQPDLDALPNNTTLDPGDTWHFQIWFRDGFTSNTSDGIEVLFR